MGLSGPEIVKPKGLITETKIVNLKDGSLGTLYPIYANQIDLYPDSLIEFLFHEFNKEIFKGDTYPQLNELTKEEFVDYWFGAFHVLLLKGDHPNFNNESDWNELWLGSFYIKPNYAGRCSHVCNGGFFVNFSKRGLSIGKILGKTYLQWAPILGYTYSVFNLVFESNVASAKLWDSLGFDRIGLVPEAAILKGQEKKVNAIIFGKNLE